MDLFRSIGKAVTGAVGKVGEKNRRSAYLSRVRTVIRCEEKAAEREYLALGRYYYNNLRSADNPVTEAHCASLDEINGRLDKALEQLDRLYQEPETEEPAVRVHLESLVEEITLDDVAGYDSDPMPEAEAPGAEPAPAVEEAPAAEPVPPVEEAPAAGPVPAAEEAPAGPYEPSPMMYRPYTAAPAAREAAEPVSPAEPDENDALPFE